MHWIDKNKKVKSELELDLFAQKSLKKLLDEYECTVTRVGTIGGITPTAYYQYLSNYYYPCNSAPLGMKVPSNANNCNLTNGNGNC